MPFTIASWNVNSIRVRLPHVLEWLKEYQPDVLALQETKVTDELFPCEEFAAVGYHAIYTGQKSYNGMATLSKAPLIGVEKEIATVNPKERRVLGSTCNDVRIWNVYVPNGESVTSTKYPYKLAWLDSLKEFLIQELIAHPNLIVLGDFNIAPAPEDVYDPASWENQVLFSPPERERLHGLMTIGLQDCFRLFEQPEKSYTWWDYRLNAFKRNMGLRIDHILVSPNMAKQCVRCTIDKTPRSWERPSDHAPVVAVFNLR